MANRCRGPFWTAAWAEKTGSIFWIRSKAMTNMDRRTLLKAMGATSLTPLVIGSSAGPAAAEGADLKPTSTETIYFRGWPYKPEVVSDNVNRYNSEQGGHVDY